MDSPSNILSHLDLTESIRDSRFKGMDDMDIDMVYEVQDTPESGSRMGFRKKAHSRHHRRESCRHVTGSGSAAGNDTEQKRRRDRIIQQINESFESSEHSAQAHDEVLEFEPDKRSSERGADIHGHGSYHHRHRGQRWKKGKEKYPVFDGGEGVRKSRGKGKEFDLGRDSVQHDAPSRNLGQRRSGHSRFISPCSLVKGQRDEVGGHNIGDDFYDQCDERGVDTLSLSETNSRKRQGHLQQSHCDSLPYNMTEDKNTTNDYWVGRVINDARSDGNSSRQYNVSPDFEFTLADKKKGKMISSDSSLSDAQYSKAKLHSDRLCSVKGKEETYVPDDYNAPKTSENIAWRSHKAPVLLSEESTDASRREGKSKRSADCKHKFTMADGDYVDLVNNSPSDSTENVGWQRRRRFMKGKKKHSSNLSSYGGGCSSNFEHSELAADLQSPRHMRDMPNTRLIRDSQNCVEVDEPQFSYARWTHIQEQSTGVSDPLSTSINQVESDEILALQLQEQFYDELVGSAGTEEQDARLAWSLQAEDARRAASAFNQTDQREASMAHLYSYYAQLPYRNYSASSSNRAQARMSNRRTFNSSEIDLEIRMMEEARNFSAMDMGRRRNFLDALEAAFDHSNDALEDNYEFNANDYEMLLALDDNIHHHVGASENQINSIPQSIVQSGNSEETCAICLENPSVGENIRHLPCTHKFHKECIDKWLRKRIWCPVCRSEIM